MLTNSIWFSCGLFAGVVGTLVTFAVSRYIKTTQSRTWINKILTMERVSACVTEYLSKYPDVDEIAVAAYGPDNMPGEVSTALKGEIPPSVQHILVLVAVKKNATQKTIAVFLAQEMEPALQVSLEDGIFKMGR